MNHKFGIDATDIVEAACFFLAMEGKEPSTRMVQAFLKLNRGQGFTHAVVVNGVRKWYEMKVAHAQSISSRITRESLENHEGV